MVHAAHVGHLPDGVECQEGLKFRFVPQSFRKKRFTIYIMNEVTNCLRVQGRREKGKEKKEGREEGEGRREGIKGGKPMKHVLKVAICSKQKDSLCTYLS